MGAKILHPSELPIRLHRAEATPLPGRAEVDHDAGSICFDLSEPFEPGTTLEITIPLLEKCYRLTGCVVESQREGSGYRTSLTFATKAEAYLARAVEQACHIESYRMQVESSEGRRLSPDSAALEWIEKFAADFP